MSPDDLLREHLKELLTWRSAHAEFERVVKNVPPELRGICPAGMPYSLWQLLEHIRLAQGDILDFCTNSKYTSPQWPDEFWPSDPTPATREDWQQSIDAFRRDRQSLVDVVMDQSLDMLGAVPHGEGQTYFREVVLVADHSSYHIGQMVAVRRSLGIWPP